MYDIKQFRPVLYLVVLIGLTGYAMASESAGLWVVAVALILTNAWLIHRGQFKPIPRALAFASAFACFIYAFLQVRGHEGTPILAIGQFLVLLQVVKIWEQRANRDYAQLLVLSLLLMVAAAISTGSLLFGILFIVYLFLSLYSCLLFHLKVETDQAKAALSPAGERWGDTALKQDQRFLSKSMRRLTGLVAVYALVAAVLVFLLFPRGTGAGMFGEFRWKPQPAMTGFSEQVNFNQVARITENDEQVGTIKIWNGAQPQLFRGALMLRGVTHDYYNGTDDTEHAAFQWGHTPRSMEFRGHRWSLMGDDSSGTWSLPGSLADTDRSTAGDHSKPPRYREEIELSPTGTPTLFSLPGVISVRLDDSGHRLAAEYNTLDQTIRASATPQLPIKYEVMATDSLDSVTPREGSRERWPMEPSHSHIDPSIAEYARRTDVVGDLAARRAQLAAARPDKGLFYVSPLDEQIAEKIESYLQHHFTYTLDLTNENRVPGRDPMVGFLYDFKKGHCEYFAGAMTLMCQSLGIHARLVVGFKCDDYNDFGHFYTIRQNQAHAWVEVLTTNGWETFDPTSGDQANARLLSVWEKTKHFFDFMEYTWQNSVIAYNSENRDNLIQAVDTRLNQTASRSANNFSGITEKLAIARDWLASEVVGPLVGLLTLGIFAAFGWFFFERWKLRRKAKRIGIKDLPPSDQAKLLRQLGFYDDLLLLLEKHHIVRPAHLTPMEFSSTLSFLPGDAYHTVRRLTHLFYKIRYGSAELDDGQRKRLATVIDRLSRSIAPINAER
jgi:transglutaminase-like putative cysteine protease